MEACGRHPRGSPPFGENMAFVPEHPDTLSRLADDLDEAVRAARHAGQDGLAHQIAGQVEVLRWAQSPATTAPDAPSDSGTASVLSPR